MVAMETDNKNPQTETLVIFSIGNHSNIMITVNTMSQEQSPPAYLTCRYTSTEVILQYRSAAR